LRLKQQSACPARSAVLNRPRNARVVHETQSDQSGPFGNVASLRHVKMIWRSRLKQQINPEVFRMMHQLLIEPLGERQISGYRRKPGASALRLIKSAVTR